MFYDEAINCLRMDATFDLPIRRSIARRTDSWTGRWLEWRDGQLTECYDGNLRTGFGDPLSLYDLSAKDWEVQG